MLPRKPEFWLLVCMILVVVGLWWWWSQSHQFSKPALVDGQVVAIELGNQAIEVEVAKSPHSITKGLSGRSSIGSDGMLFIYNRAHFPKFWMKQMQFDLDFIWLLDGTIVEITPKVPHPDPQLTDFQLPIYKPSVPANQVLEVPAGSAEKWGITVGDQLEIK